ncbi:SGNH/GDSL hydrolase family protein [Neorhodopirellula lusitana]|uniref:SGNH/GDSL hydrolase family protein n=1 Tax=Neorhodopirellula lusitana TaxID=445327 RepID=UPI00384FDF49
MRTFFVLLFCSIPFGVIDAQEKQTTPIASLDPEMADGKHADDGLSWHDVTEWGVEGRILPDQERQRWFDRLPGSAEGNVTNAVWNLSRHSAGMMVRFKTDATSIDIDYKLLTKNLQMSHMPATGVSGVDLYARDDSGKWRWVQVTRPTSQEVKTKLVDGLAEGDREFAAYLPLFNGVESMSIGVPPDSKFEFLAPRTKPIVFYGTSITHGACASRPGMVHTAILGRRFDTPVVNLGFSGNGKMDAAVGDFLTQIDAAVFVIDCLPNMNASMVSQKCVPLVQQIREKKPDTPIVLVEDRRNTNSWILPTREKHHIANHNALQTAYEKLKSESVNNLYYISGDALYGSDGEGSTDGSHASDLGFMRQADVFDPVLRQALGLVE